MPIAADMSHMVPNHILRVGQTICLDPAQDTSPMRPSRDSSDLELDMSLDTLNQLILELDPSFQPIPISQHTDSSPEDDMAGCVLVPRGCARGPSLSTSPSRSVPIPVSPGPSCSPHGSLVFSGSPSSCRPPLPCGSVRRRASSQQHHMSCSPGALGMCASYRNSGSSLLSTSPGSDTSYMLGSSVSLFSEDSDSPEALVFHTSGSFSDVSRPTGPFGVRQSPDRPSPTGPSPLDHFQGLHSKGIHSSPASLAGSLTDIPVVLVNGAPEPEPNRQSSPQIALPQTTHPSTPLSPHSFQGYSHGSQASMKFVMDTSKYWFRPLINRVEAEALLRDQQPGAFVVRDSTSYRGAFGLAMKVDQASSNTSPKELEVGSELIRHFLIESSPKGVRIKGSSHEPYFGNLSALVYQHTITAYALPCKLLLQSHDLDSVEGKPHGNEQTASENNTKTASNFLYLSAVPTEMLTGPQAVKRAVTSSLQKDSTTPTVVNIKVSPKGVTLTDIQRKLFFRRHYPAHLLSYSGEDPDRRMWLKGSKPARIFGIVAKGTEPGMGNMCHIFAEYDSLQPCNNTIELIQGSIALK
ncbi:tensin-4-like [Aplochiton taeniatus]